MEYRLKRTKAYWALVLHDDRVVAHCHRGTAYKWFVYIDTRPPEWVKGEFNSVEDAFNAFIAYKVENKNVIRSSVVTQSTVH